MRYFTESEVRDALRRKLRGRTQTEVAKEAGISRSMMSQLVHGAPMTGKVLVYLGYCKVRKRLYCR